jgi:hypothetical protein
MTTLRALAFFAIALTVAIAVACSGGTSTSSGSGVTSGYCSSVSDYAKQCNKTDQCTQDIIAACPSITSQFSGAYLAAATACLKPPYDCSDGGNPGLTHCLDQQLASATPTAAQMQVKNDFCLQCPDGADKNNPTACSQFFTITYDDAGKMSSPGYFVLVVNDSLAQQIDQRCTGLPPSQDGGSGFGCAGSFEICSALVYGSSSNLPKSCNSSGKSLRLPPTYE